MKPKYPHYTRRCLAVAGAFTTLLAAHIAYAASATWNGTNNATWADTGNWSASPVPGTGDTATFNNAGNSNVVIDLGTGVTLTSILFDTNSAAAYAIGTSGSQILTLDINALIKNNSNTVNNQLVNASIVLGTTSDAAFTFTNEKIGTTVTFAGGISNGTNAGVKTLTVNGASNTLISGNITDGSGGTVVLVKTGAGTLGLSGTNNYTGATTVTTGALSYLKTAAKSSGAINVGAGATLGLGLSGTGAFTPADVTALFGSTLTGVTMASGSNVGIDTTLGDLTYSTNMPSSNMGFVKLGSNKLALAGTNSYLGDTTVFKGTLELQDGSSITSAGSFFGGINNNRSATIMSGYSSMTFTDSSKWATVGIDNDANNPSSLVMSGHATITTAAGFSVGGWGPTNRVGSAEFAMKDDATLNVTPSTNGWFYVQGDPGSGTSHMQIQDRATLNTNRLRVSRNFGSLTQTGGTVNCNFSSVATTTYPWLLMVANNLGRWGFYNLTGGTWNINANPGGHGYELWVCADRGFGFLNITGTGSVNMADDALIDLSNHTGGYLGYYGEVNLAGGNLKTWKIKCTDQPNGDVKGGSVNFNGGTLKAAKSEANFMTAIPYAMVYPGGAVIDTNTFDIGIAVPLQEPASMGVTSVSVTPGTQTYIAPPIVYFTEPPGGLAQRAQGFATLDSSGHIDNVIITKPGIGYVTAPTMSFDHGDATATCTIGDISGGGLTKNSDGTLTLGGANTYTGDTVVNQGSLVLADDADLKFKIAANHVCNKVTGAGTVQLNGDFVIDVSGATKVKGNTWTLVNHATLNESYGTTFTVADWALVDGKWQLPDGDNTWKFDPLTGVLSYVSALTPYEIWAQGYPTAILTDPAADYDGDGLSNQEEFAFGQDPTKGSSANPISSVLTTGGQFSYKRTVDSGLTYSVWTSENLATWTEDTGAIQTPGAIVGTVQTYSVQLSATPSGTKFFVRVKATE